MGGGSGVDTQEVAGYVSSRSLRLKGTVPTKAEGTVTRDELEAMNDARFSSERRKHERTEKAVALGETNRKRLLPGEFEAFAWILRIVI